MAAFTPPAPSAAAAALTSRSAVLRAVPELTPAVDDLGRRVAERIPLAGAPVAMVSMVPARAALDQPAIMQRSCRVLDVADRCLGVRRGGARAWLSSTVRVAMDPAETAPV